MITVPHSLRNTILRGISECQIVFISAGAGWGKTAVLRKLLEKQNYKYISLRSRNAPAYFSKDHTVVIDDFQELSPAGVQQFKETLRKAPKSQHYVLLSRAPLPEYLAAYEVKGALTALSAKDFRLDLECITQLAESHKVSLSPSDLQRVHETTGGYPVAVVFLLKAIADGKHFDQATIDAVYEKVGAYLEEAMLRQLDVGKRRLLMDMSFFTPSVDAELMQELTEDGDVESGLEEIRCCTGLVSYERGAWSLTDPKFLKPYLRHRADLEYRPEKIRSIHFAGGRWYAKKDEFKSALDHYKEAESREDIIRALHENARRHPGIGAYYEMREYYNMLTEDEIRESPDMICAMSMLRSMTFDAVESERWYSVLKERVGTMNRRSKDYKRVCGLLAYLDISLPHRGSANVLESLSDIFALGAGKSLEIPELSVTSNLPSLLHGGKDFSDWISRDRELYDTMRTSVESMLGRGGVGLTEIALTESMMEKGQDVTGQFLKLAPLQNELHLRGTPEMEFVLTALFVRAFYASGDMRKAMSLLEHFREEMEQRSYRRIIRNIDAMRCRLSLMADDSYEHTWFVEDAPDERKFSAMERYRYLAKIRCYIKRKEFQSALLLLGRMLDYTKQYDRPYEHLESLILASICRYRMKGDDWREYFEQAIDLGIKYGYVAVFSREGAALLPLLENYDHKEVGGEYWKKILSSAVVQAGYYPHYMQPLDGPETPLTNMETMILRLICQDWVYEDICGLLDIKMPTVKTHVRNIFKKLDVANRAEAQKVAQRLRLV